MSSSLPTSTHAERERWGHSKMTAIELPHVPVGIFQTLWVELRAANAMAMKTWRVELAYPLSVLYFIFAPLLWMLPALIFGFAILGQRESPLLLAATGYTGDYLAFTGLGSAFLSLMVTSFWSTAWALRKESWEGTFESVYVTPVSRFSLVLGNSIHSVEHVGSGIVIQMILLVVVAGVNIRLDGVPWAVLAMLVSVLSVQGIGYYLSALVLRFRQGWMIGDLVTAFLGIITPALYPLEVFVPFPLLYCTSLFSPITWGVETFRQSLLRGFFSELTPMILVLFVLGILSILSGAWVFHWQSTYCRKIGAMGKF
jgi:ABC-type multidrug transport system permease subunit